MDKLTPRLLTIAKEISVGETVCDIGTDHGYLPIYLFKNKISPKVILADVSKGSLSKAKENCKNECIELLDYLRLGDGLNVLSNGEVDTIVIAGMGGLLTSEILSSNIEKTKSFKKFILQPRNHIGELRYFLYSNGFKIINEKLVAEEPRICEVITAVVSHEKNDDLRENTKECPIYWEFPETLLNFKNELSKPYIEEHISKEENILTNKLKAKEIDKKEIENQKYRVSYLKELYSKL